MRHEVIEMHLFDNNAPEEKALCGEGTPAHDRMGVDYYLELRSSGLGVGTVCEQCKALVMPFAVNVSRNPEGDGEVAEGEACCS